MQQEIPVPVYARRPRVVFHINGVPGDEGSFRFARIERYLSISSDMPS